MTEYITFPNRRPQSTVIDERNGKSGIHGIVYLLKNPRDPLLHVFLFESPCLEEVSQTQSHYEIIYYYKQTIRVYYAESIEVYTPITSSSIVSNTFWQYNVNIKMHELLSVWTYGGVICSMNIKVNRDSKNVLFKNISKKRATNIEINFTRLISNFGRFSLELVRMVKNAHEFTN